MSVVGDVAAHGCVRLTGDSLRLLREQLTLPDGKPLAASFLKHADDQTVAAFAAVFQAIERFGMAGVSFTDWAVLAAPRFLGRMTMVSALQRFGDEGAWGVSPHLIPHRSLHSVSGSISQVLQIHGPNYGIGGGPDCASEIFLAVTALLGREHLPGVWVVLTGWQPEPTHRQADSLFYCYAAALALKNAQVGRRGMQLRLIPGAPLSAEGRPISVESLVEALAETPLPAQVEWALDGGGRMELLQVGSGTCAGLVAERRAG